MSETREARLERIAATGMLFTDAGWKGQWRGTADRPHTHLTNPPSTGTYIPSRPTRYLRMGDRLVLQNDTTKLAPPRIVKAIEEKGRTDQRAGQQEAPPL